MDLTPGRPKPGWLEHVYAPSQGLDHLGLATVSQDRVLEALSPGIRALTIHPRYFSFYAFVIDEFWSRDLPRTPVSFKDFYRSCELVYSVGVNACGHPTRQSFSSVVGSSKTKPWADEKLDPLPQNLDYIQTGLGGYGLYYRGRMKELEVIVGFGDDVPMTDGTVSHLPVDICTSTYGKRLADSFRQVIADTDFYRHYLGTGEPVPFEVVSEFGKAGCLCGLANKDAPDREPLLDMFMHAGDRPDARRAAFRFLLDVAMQTEGHSVSEDDFRALIYYGATNRGASLTPHRDLVPSYRGWRLYQAREYYAFALNSLWACLCDHGISLNGDLSPIALDDIHAAFGEMAAPKVVALAFEGMDPGLGPNDRWSDVVDWYREAADAQSALESDCARLDLACSEKSLVELSRSQTSSRVAAAIGILALVVARFGDNGMSEWPEWKLAQLGADGRLSMEGFLRDIEEWNENKSLTLGVVVSRLLDRYIIAQHLLIATRKLPENTFRFEREGEGLRFYQLQNPVEFTNSRFEALTTHLTDLGLCGEFSAVDHPLTVEGRRLLETGEL